MEKIAIYKIARNGEKLVELRECSYEALAEALEWAKENIEKEDEGAYFQICTVVTECGEDASEYENANIDFIHYEIYKDVTLENEYGQMVEIEA